MDTRRFYFVDWLRVLAVLLLFPFHTGRVFNAGEAFYVKGPDTSTSMGTVLAFIGVWHMPLLFALAGASTYLALGRRTPGEYARERVQRLLVPFVFGVLVLIPPQTWFGARLNSGYTGSYGGYLTGGDFLEIDFGRDDYFGGFGTGHLWFILFLFIISLVALPLWAGRRTETSRLIAFSRVLAHPTGWLLAGLLILVGEALPDVSGENPFYYFAFFALGYVTMCSDQFMESAARFGWMLLAAGGAVSVWWVASADWRDGLADPSMALFGVVLVGMTARWMVIVGLLGVGSRMLDRISRTLVYLAEASYPVYILHQTVIVVVAFYLVGWDAPWTVQWAVLLAASVALTFTCYEGVRRVGWLRFCFGMRPRRGAPRKV